MALSKSAIRAIAIRRSATKVAPAPRTRRPRRVVADLAPLSALTHAPFMGRGQIRTAGMSTVQRFAGMTVFSRNSTTGGTLDDLIVDFDAVFGEGSWNRFGGQGVIVSVNDVPADDLSSLYALEYPNALVDSNVG